MIPTPEYMRLQSFMAGGGLTPFSAGMRWQMPGVAMGGPRVLGAQGSSQPLMGRYWDRRHMEGLSTPYARLMVQGPTPPLEAAPDRPTLGRPTITGPPGGMLGAAGSPAGRASTDPVFGPFHERAAAQARQQNQAQLWASQEAQGLASGRPPPGSSPTLDYHLPWDQQQLVSMMNPRIR
jgi:hypothetical protein